MAKRPKHEKDLWEVFSVYIRMRDATIIGRYGKCCTCGRVIRWQDGDAGHWITSARGATRYHEFNVHLQCKRCNAFGYEGGRGEPGKHEAYIRKQHGEQVPDILRSLPPKKWTELECKALMKHYRSEIAKMKNKFSESIDNGESAP